MRLLRRLLEEVLKKGRKNPRLKSPSYKGIEGIYRSSHLDSNRFQIAEYIYELKRAVM